MMRVEEGRLEEYLKRHETKKMLRFITCGSVDDGKSTLIGRLLWDSKLIYEDQLSTLEVDSRKVGTQGQNVDFALLLDGLQAEREQGITIDVAYRFFSTDKRKFIVADTPGHEEYTRNMVTGASTAEVAVILVDARKGVLIQTKRHSFLASLVGIHRVVLAVNKMDLVDYDRSVFESIVTEYREFAATLGFDEIVAIPVSALMGDNVFDPSVAMTWYDGPTIMYYLEHVDPVADREGRGFRFPVQLVNRPNSDFRGFSGTVQSGEIAVGDEIVIPRNGMSATVASIVAMPNELEKAVSGESITLTLDREIDVSRGDVLCKRGDISAHADQFKANLVWMDESPLFPGRSYVLKMNCGSVPATVTDLKERIDVNTLDNLPAKSLCLNEVGVVNLALGTERSFDSYAHNPATGGFILIDRQTNATVGAGMIQYPLRRATNVHEQDFQIEREDRSRMLMQDPLCVWFTGLSGSGKSTIADALVKELHSRGKLTYILDGDNIRRGLNRDLGFTEADRVENIRRVGEVARLMVDAGLVVICSFISPYRSERRSVRSRLGDAHFVEVFVDTPLEICEQRDPKGLYKKARSGSIPNFTGINSPYEAPENPDIVVHTEKEDLDAIVIRLLDLLANHSR